MTYCYTAVKEKHQCQSIGDYVAYGIRVTAKENGGEREVMYVPDVSEDEELVERLAMLCTAEELDPIHLPDVIEDSI